MKIKKIIMILLFILGFSELLVGIAMGFYPSLILGSCLLYGAVALRNRIKKCRRHTIKNNKTEKFFSKELALPTRHGLTRKDYLISTGLSLFSVMFICTALTTSTFPCIVVGILFGFFAVKKILNKSKKGSDYYADDSKTVH